jgi:DNA invertase Pin-like site-specific DNA recombinase
MPRKKGKEFASATHGIPELFSSCKKMGGNFEGGRLMLTVLGGLAEFERELIKARTSEGRARAIRDGVRIWDESQNLACIK